MAEPQQMSGPPAGAPPPPPGQNVTYYVYQMQAPHSGGSGGDIKVNWGACFTFYFLRSLLALLLWAAWVLLVAGASENQKECNSGNIRNSPYTLGIFNSTTVFSTADCAQFFALLWWATWFQFVVACLVTITTISVFARFKCVKSIFTTTMYFSLMSTVLLFFISNTYVTASYIIRNKQGTINSPVTGDFEPAAYLTAVGAVASAIVNFFYIIWNSYADVPVFPGQNTAPVPQIDGDAYVAPQASKGSETA